MHTQAIATRSRSCLFTSLYGFMRIAIADTGTLDISPNLMSQTGNTDSARRDLNVNFRIMQEFFFFVFGSVVMTYGPDKILPPKFRQEYQNPTYTKLKEASSPLTFPRFFAQYIRDRLLGTKAWAWNLALKMFGGSLITFAAEIEVPSLPGKFKRVNNRQAVLSYNE
jgi:hypothetical protein